MDSAKAQDIASELRAYAALADVERGADLTSIARSVLEGAASARRSEWADAAKVDALAAEKNLERPMADTPFGNVLSVLSKGPEDGAERSLARAIAARAFADANLDGPNRERVVSDILWLAAHTPFDATLLLPRAFGDKVQEVLSAMGDQVARTDDRGAHGRAEALAACACLASLPEGAVVSQRLLEKLRDPALVRMLSVHNAVSTEGADLLQGELASASRGPVLTALMGVTGLLALVAGVRLFLRLALGLKRPCDVTFSQASIRVKARTEMLGRTIKEEDFVILRSALVRATREVRYPRSGLYAGLLALGIGTWLGVSLLVDGARAASPTLLIWGVVLLVVGVGLEFVLTSLLPGRAGQCRVAFTPKTGRVVCVRDVDQVRADQALARLR